MAYIDMTHPWIVNEARRRFTGLVSAGDSAQSALTKAIDGALQQHWRRRPIDMQKSINKARYGDQYAELENLVSAEGRQNDA